MPVMATKFREWFYSQHETGEILLPSSHLPMFLGCSVAYARRLINRGDIEEVYYGEAGQVKRYVFLSSVEEYIKKRRIEMEW